MVTQRTKQTIARTACLLVWLLAICAAHVSAQSTDVAWPSPVRTNEVRGTIVARDIGDPRVTDHFYAFTGTPGDVLITLESRNLNGDVDVFTFNGMRPLLKFTVYAGSSSLITKTIYLRKQEDLILRVEGRTPNDDEAVYRLRFGGSFAPIVSGPLAEHEDTNQPETTASVSKGGRRVSSVGATIDQPPSEVAEAPQPEPTPEVVTPEPKVAATKPPRAIRPRRPAARRTRPVEKPKPAEETAKTETEEKGSGETAEKPTVETSNGEGHTATTPARKGRNSRASNSPPATAPEPEASGPRLVIETSDGTLVDKYMSSVRRVTVENGQVVVIGKDGKIQRIPLVNVVRMTITQ
jgi:outer membrane biosynthesis protein TonB